MTRAPILAIFFAALGFLEDTGYEDVMPLFPGGEKLGQVVMHARLPVEKVVATAWLAGIALSGWLVNYGPILLTIDLERAGEISPVSVFIAIAAVLFLLAGSSWVGLKIVSDLLCLRKIRKDLDQ